MMSGSSNSFAKLRIDEEMEESTFESPPSPEFKTVGKKSGKKVVTPPLPPPVPLPLQKIRPFFDKWSLYFHLSNDQEWNANSYKIIMHNINNPTHVLQLKREINETIVIKSMLFIMRDGILPMWEDPKNKNGGCFSFKIPSPIVHSVWWDFVFLLCGETLIKDHTKKHLINGLTISPKYDHSIIKIWLKDLSFQDYSQLNISALRHLDSQKPLFKKHGNDK